MKDTVEIVYKGSTFQISRELLIDLQCVQGLDADAELAAILETEWLYEKAERMLEQLRDYS